ncbi:M28 family peptidase [Bacillus sp. DNRA2]|uniref:M28 family peptidase n=1 Tax=Bacillus sp. DNRA2 TaxID=2723053 RepID=UPI00145FB627|nr:M28 family peptidase [Bacillus sp. DNRA2]NMD72827.1 M28 family peptidase [Bacillus sp. DNRA2]
MKKWNQLFIRQGFMVEELERNIFNCTEETEENVTFLLENLDRLSVAYAYESGQLTISSPAVSEEQWLKVVDRMFRGRQDIWARPGVDIPEVRNLDLYISGIVRQLIRLGFQTTMSCDGHGKRAAFILVTKSRKVEELSDLFLAMGLKRVHTRNEGENYHLSLPFSQSELLDLAEKLSLIEVAWIGKGCDFLKEQLFRLMLDELLMIQGESGREAAVRQFVMEKLRPHVDHLTVDCAGNILAEKTYRSGNGPTILLNAHLDTVIDFEVGRQIVKNGRIWTSSNGILGADDRAGVAVILQLAEFLNCCSTFSGRVKFIFTVEEESGLVGARKVDDYFLWGTDAAIVVDRRGNGDIVTSCGGSIPFCDELYGQIFENVAVAEGLEGWSVCPGGSSDTRIWAGHGIQSVNLSAGYKYEHTDQELLDVTACYGTVTLLKGFFKKSGGLRTVLRNSRANISANQS